MANECTHVASIGTRLAHACVHAQRQLFYGSETGYKTNTHVLG